MGVMGFFLAGVFAVVAGISFIAISEGSIVLIVFGVLIFLIGFVFLVPGLIYTDDEIERFALKKPRNVTDGYCNMLKHILLLIFFGWVWQYVWIYRVTRYLNIIQNEEKRNPTTKLLLCMFVPFYYIYWIYQSARRIDRLAKENNMTSDITVFSVVFSLFTRIVAPIIMQNKLNKISSLEE